MAEFTAGRQAVFSVVSGTTLRFVSLVAAVLGTSTFAFSVLYTKVPANGYRGVLTYARCQELFRRHPAPPPDVDMVSAANISERANRDLSRCLAPFEQTQATWILAGLGVLLAVAAALYLLAPWWTRRRGHLVALTGAEFPELYTALAGLVAVAGLRRPPGFVLDPAAGMPGGLAFGRTGRYTVRLNAGLVPLAVTDPAMFRAIVLHELAHIRNRDVDIAYAAVALWRSFVVVALLPFAVALLHPVILHHPLTLPRFTAEYAMSVLNYGSRALLFVAVVYLSRNAVLRTRETYADARAAGYAGADGLRRAVSTATARPVRRWRRWIGVHPDPALRLRVIDDPVGLLRPRFGEMFGAGLTTMIATGAVVFYAGLALPHTGSPSGRAVAWMVAPIAVGVLGAAAWRGEVMSALGRTRVSVVPPVLGFSLGWLLGDLVSIPNGAGIWGVFGARFAAGELGGAGATPVGGISVSAGVVSALLLTAGMLCQAGVSAAGARCWLPVLRGRTMLWGWAAGVAATMIPFAVWFGIWSEVHSTPYLVGHLYHPTAVDVARLGVEFWQGPGVAQLTTMYPPLTIFSGRALAIPAVALAWLYPLAAWLPRPSRTSRLALRFALLTAAAGAGAFAVVLLAARAGLHRYAPDRAGAADFAGYFYYCMVALAVLIQAVVGGVLAVRIRPLGIRPLGVVLGQFAAGVTAVAAAAVVLGGQLLGGCLPAFRLRSTSCRVDFDAGYTMTLLRYLMIEGAIAALAAGTLVTVMVKVAGRLPQGFAPLRSRGRLVGSLAVASTVLLLAATGALAIANSRPMSGPAAPASPVAHPSPPVATSADPGRVLTDAETDTVARAVIPRLPAYWRPGPPDRPSDATVEPQACEALASDGYLQALDPDKRASAKISYADRAPGDLSSSILGVAVSSYATPIPASVFAAAEADRAACPQFTATLSDGFQVVFTVSAGPAPTLGEQAWRVNYGLSSRYTTGTTGTVMVRVGHNLITASMVATNVPLDETLLQEALTRTVEALVW